MEKIDVNTMMEWVENNYPYVIKFNTDFSVIKSIELYLTNGKPYVTMICMYGILFFLAAIEYYKYIEDYERCQEMVESVRECNDIYKFDLPMSMDDPFCQYIKNLSPLEILAVLTGK